MPKEMYGQPHFRKDLSYHIPGDVVARESRNSFLKNLIITQIGYFEYAEGHLADREGIPEYVMLYCVHGKGWINTNGRRQMMGIGDLAFCSINRPHGYGADESEPWTIHWIHFIGEGIPDIFKWLGITPQTPIIHVGVDLELVSLVQNACKSVAHGYSFPDLFSASTCFQEFFSRILKIKMYSGLQRPDGYNMENIVQMMHRNLNQTLTLQKLADNMNMSKYHFVRRFKEITGYSPMDYFCRMKVQKACEMLDTTSESIKEISEALSFSNPFYFSEVFKRITGYSPRGYRRLQKAL